MDIFNAVEKSLRVALYVRVSTVEQAQEGYSIDEQKRRLVDYCKARGWIVAEVLVDPGYSGSNLNRPGIQTLISHIKNYDMVLVYKLDRLSRSQRDTLYLIEQVFLPNHVDFVSLNESFDTSTPFGRAMIGILSVFAQLEREQIKERTAMGRLARWREGKSMSSRPPIGYDYDPEAGTLVVNEYEAAQIRLIYQLYLGGDGEPGWGYQKIADYMQAHGYTHKYGDWRHKQTVYLALSNPVYVGDTRYNGELILDTHEALVSRETFALAKKIHDTREERTRGAMRSNHLLTGFVYCACCGARVSCVLRGGQSRYYYVCYSRNPANPTMVRDPDCPCKSWPKEELEAVVDYEVRQLIFDREALGPLVKRSAIAVSDPEDHSAALQRKLENLDKQIARLMDLYQDGTLPVDLLNERVKKLYAEREALAANLTEAPVPDESFGMADARAYLDEIGPIWDKATTAQKREILSVLVNGVYVREDNYVQIDWAFL